MLLLRHRQAGVRPDGGRPRRRRWRLTYARTAPEPGALSSVRLSLGGFVDLDLGVETQSDRAVVRVGGELDAHTATQLRQCLLGVTSEGPLQVTLDLSELSFVDSTGLGVLIGALKRQRTRGGTLTLTGLSGPVRRVFEITRLVETFDIAEPALDESPSA
ncbi:MAG TPA: STAS domain-containing protein [Sporichthya sp.]|nr:STAS domain-containing protein [Sporichthya sp.]